MNSSSINKPPTFRIVINIQISLFCKKLRYMKINELFDLFPGSLVYAVHAVEVSRPLVPIWWFCVGITFFNFVLSKNTKSFYIAFLLVGILWWIKFNGIVMLPIISLIFFLISSIVVARGRGPAQSISTAGWLSIARRR